MEQSVEAPFHLPRRRSHLPSRTYHSLVRICSRFNGESRVSLSTPIVLQELLLRSDDNTDNEAAQVSLEETSEPGEICPPPDDTQPENSSMLESRTFQNESAPPQCCNDVGFGESRIVSNGIENVMTEKTDNTQENSLMPGNNFDTIDLQGGMDGRSQNLMDELDIMLNESDDLLQEDCMNLLETLDVSDGDIDMIQSLLDDAENPLDSTQNVLEKTSIATELQGGPIESDKKIPEPVDLSPEKGMAKEIPKSADSKEGRSTEVSKDYDKTQPREMELKKSATSSGGLVTSVTQMVEDEDIEEGEISGDVYIDYDLPLGDDVPVERMGWKQVTEEIINNRGTNDSFHAIKENSSSRLFCAVVSPPENVGEKGRRESRDKFDVEVGNLDDGMTVDDKVEKKASESHETSNAELNAGSSKKKKSARAPRSEKSKANKKANFRKRRAEERRLLGVKRLKLKPIVPKPKPVKYCRHYLKGRCQEGENCKFSHDIVPPTKSSPCCYFATQSCMKGDDCPFDHDLSKYPCTNFTTKGFCHRGDNCLFSHKGTSLSASDASGSGTAPSSVSPFSHSKEKPRTTGPSPNKNAAAPFSFGVSPQKTELRTEADTRSKPPPAFPVRVSSLLGYQKPSSQPYQGSSSPKVIEHGKTQTPTRKPSVAPKGISFLSLDKTSSESNTTTSQHDTASSSAIENLLKVVFQKTAAQSTPSSNSQNSKETLPRSPLPPAPPKGISSLSPGSDRRNETTLAKASDEHRSSDTAQFQPPTSSQPSTSGQIKATPNLQTQKTLISALKLAAEFESGKTKKCTNDAAAVNKRDTDSPSNAAHSKNNSSKILEFLASFSRLQ